MKMVFTESPTRALLDILISSVTWVFPMTTVSWSVHPGTRPWDCGIWDLSRPPESSRVTIRKSFPALSVPITDRSFLPELIRESSYGTTEVKTSSPVKKATIRTGSAVSDTHLSSRLTPLISAPLVGMAESRFGTLTSRSDAVSSITKRTSTVSPSPPMVNTSPLPEPERLSESGMSPAWVNSPENSNLMAASLS